MTSHAAPAFTTPALPSSDRTKILPSAVTGDAQQFPNAASRRPTLETVAEDHALQPQDATAGGRGRRTRRRRSRGAHDPGDHTHPSHEWPEAAERSLVRLRPVQAPQPTRSGMRACPTQRLTAIRAAAAAASRRTHPAPCAEETARALDAACPSTSNVLRHSRPPRARCSRR